MKDSQKKTKYELGEIEYQKFYFKDMWPILNKILRKRKQNDKNNPTGNDSDKKE